MLTGVGLPIGRGLRPPGVVGHASAGSYSDAWSHGLNNGGFTFEPEPCPPALWPITLTGIPPYLSWYPDGKNAAIRPVPLSGTNGRVASMANGT